ncbi:MAG: methyltransferase domain-containing protein [Atopobiaceae bacterium]|nr:methyltransferase domain-containing protein [Atopobiaceae bacterium]
MSRRASQFQKRVMSLGYRGKEVFKPLNTGWIDDHVACVREWIANIFFYTKDGTTIMIDAGYSYERLGEKMAWLGIDPASIAHVLVTHQDTDHVGALERDGCHLLDAATLYIGRIEDRYLTGKAKRKVIFGLYTLPQVTIDNEKVLLDDGDVFWIEGIKVEAILVPGHTWGHMVYLVDDAYLFTGDTIWFGPDGGYSFINGLAEDNEMAVESLARLERLLRERGIAPKVITGHTGWSDDLDFVFSHTDEVCIGFKRQKPHDPSAPYDGYDESEDTEQRAREERLAAVVPVSSVQDEAESARGFWNRMAPLYDVAMGGGDLGLEEAVGYVASFVQPHDVVLDAACGTGAFACGVAPRAGFVAACDLSPKMLARTRRKAQRLGLKNVVCGTGDLYALEFSTGSFDVAIAGNLLHLLAEPQQAVTELQRVTRPGGIIAIPNYMNEEDTDRRFLELAMAAGFAVHSEWNSSSFLEFLASCGLTVIEHGNFAAKQPLCVAICQN